MFSRKLITFCFLSCGAGNGLSAQTTAAVKDTIETINFSTGISINSFNDTTYLVNGQKADAGSYYHYDSLLHNIDKCRPCVLRAYNIDHQLVTESVQYKDCGAGKITAYYPSGAIKFTGQYKENNTGNWDPLSFKCFIKKGLWEYYDEQGKITKVERYREGHLYE